MRFDKILDFLFRRASGLILSIVATVVAVFAFSGCFAYDCSIWTCRTVTCNENACQGCEATTNQWNDEQYSRYIKMRFGKNEWKKQFMTDKQIEDTYTELDCYFSDEGCESEQNCGYIVCGGTNLSCWNTICDGGLCINQIKLYDGNQACTCLNCTIYCDGKPSENTYIPDDHGRSCSGCDNALYKPRDYNDTLYNPYYTVGITEMKGGCASQKTPDGIGTNYGTYRLKGMYDETFATVMIYDATKLLPTARKAGYDFRGYYTERDGRGIKITDSEGLIIDKSALISASKHEVHAYFAPVQGSSAFKTRVEVSFNESVTYYTVESGADLEELIHSIIELDYGNRAISVKATYNGKTVEIASTDGFKDEYKTFDPIDYGITLYSELLVISITDDELMHTLTLHGFDSEETIDVLHKTPVSSLNAPVIEGYTYLGWSRVENSVADILSEDEEITESASLFAIYRRNVTFYLDGNAVGAQSYKMHVGETLELPDALNVPEGMRFIGWFPADGELADGTPMGEANAMTGTVTVTESFDGEIFIAAFAPCAYNVYYYVNNELYATDTYDFGVGITLTDEVDTEFHSFVGWTDDLHYLLPITEIGAEEFGDKTFYAILDPRVYTVALDSEGGIMLNPSVTVTYGAVAGTYYLEVPEKTGHTFRGWYVIKNGAPFFITDSLGTSIVDFKSDILGFNTEEELLAMRLFADWKVDTYTVNFWVNGELFNTEDVPHGSTLPIMDTPSIPGYEFINWTYFGTPFDLSTPITEGIDLFASVKPRTFKLALTIHEADGYFAWAGSEGTSAYGDFYTVNLTYGNALDLNEVEPFGDSKTFAGWGYNGVMVIDADGNVVNAELLSSITPDGSGYIHLTAMWS